MEWASDEEEEPVDAPEQPLPTPEQLCELAGEDSVEQIRELVLRGRGLRDGALGAVLAPLASLEVLSLSNNSLRTLSGWPSTLANLTTLNVNFNRLSSLEPLATCARLERLYAATNRIASLAPLACLERLTALSLYRNRLGSLDGCLDVITALPLLEEVRVKSTFTHASPCFNRVAGSSSLDRTPPPGVCRAA